MYTGRIPDNAILVTADVVGLHSHIPHQIDLISLKETLKTHFRKRYILMNWPRWQNSDAFQQISGTAVVTKFALPYISIHMDQVEQKFLATQINQRLM